MHGMDGFREKTKDYGKKLARIWKNRRDSVIGAACHGKQVSVVRICKVEGEWCISDCVKVPFVPLPEENPAEYMAEKLLIAFRTLGWEPSPVSVCLSGEDVYQEKVQLPSMQEDEMREALYWEIESRGIFAGEEFRYDFLDNSKDQECWVTAILKTRAEEWRRAYRKNSIELVGLTAMPELSMERKLLDRRNLLMGDRRFHAIQDIYDVFFQEGGWDALFAATVACFPDAQHPNLLREVAHPVADEWNWRRLGASVFAAAAVGLMGLLLVDQVQIAAVQDVMAEQKNQLALLGQEQQKKERIGRYVKETEEKQQLLASLSKEAFPWRSALAHFGTMSVDGVFLSQIVQQDGKALEVRGEAVSYDALAEFLKKFEADRDFFPDGPMLMESHVATDKGRPDAVRFTVALKPA